MNVWAYQFSDDKFHLRQGGFYYGPHTMLAIDDIDILHIICACIHKAL